MAKKYHATCDYLAAELSRKTGTTFTVLRRRVPVCDNKPERTVMRYGLKAARRHRNPESSHHDELISYEFQRMHHMTIREITRWLASLNDMIAFGFIPVDPYRSGPDTRTDV